MRPNYYLILLAFACCIGSAYAQYAPHPWSSILNFASEQRKYKGEMEDFLRRRHGSDSADFGYDISNYMITVDPFGGVYDSAKFMFPKFVGEKMDLHSVAKDSIVFRSQSIVPGSERVAVYNNGNTIIYCYLKHLSLFVYGNPVEQEERKLEVYIKYNGNWIWVANGGTAVGRK